MLSRQRLCSPALLSLLLFVVGFSFSASFAGDPLEALPDGKRDGEIKSPAKFLGFEIGARHVRHDQVVAYMRYLAEKSPRASEIEYGKTHGSRPLMALVVTSEANQEKLTQIQTRRKQLTSGREVKDLSNELVVMYMGYSVHGDEASAVNASPLVAYHLVSSLEADVEEMLAGGVFLIDPALNPDGVDRFANWSNENRGRFPSPVSVDREHQQPWPGGRTNYYWFDLNRDWLPTVHPESQGRLKIFHAWKPNVVLDFHEMSGSASFFFQPGIPARNNPLTPAKNLELTRKFAKQHAAAMNDAGELFFTEERFDDFYMGKGSTYPDLHGAVGILFEQGSTRGLRLVNERTSRTFADTVANQVRTSISSLHAAKQHKMELLKFQNQFYREALKAGSASTTTAYVVHGTPSRITAAERLLKTHAIRVLRPEDEVQLDGVVRKRDEVLVVPLAQPESNFVRSLFEPRQSFRENIFYNVSTWHLPSAFDLQYSEYRSGLPTGLAVSAAKKETAASAPETEEEVLGFAFAPVELDAPRLVAAIQRVGGSVRVAMEPLTPSNGDDQLPRGSFVLLKQPNAKRWNVLSKLIEKQASRFSIPLVRLTSAMTALGPDLGSDTLVQLPNCKPLLVVGDGTSAYVAGAMWHFLDHRMEQPATLVEAAGLSSVDLTDYTCILLPAGSYSTLSARAVEKLGDYVQSGGTVIAVASAINWLGKTGLITLDGSGDSQPADGKRLPFGEARTQRALQSIAGAFLMTEIDRTHPLGFGFPDQQVPVFRDHSLVFGAPSNSYQTAALYRRVEAGYVSTNNRNRLKDTAAVWAEQAGSGRYIMIADHPVFRGFVRSSERFLTNAMLLGPILRIPSKQLLEESGEEEAYNH